MPTPRFIFGMENNQASILESQKGGNLAEGSRTTSSDVMEGENIDPNIRLAIRINETRKAVYSQDATGVEFLLYFMKIIPKVLTAGIGTELLQPVIDEKSLCDQFNLRFHDAGYSTMYPGLHIQKYILDALDFDFMERNDYWTQAYVRVSLQVRTQLFLNDQDRTRIPPVICCVRILKADSDRIPREVENRYPVYIDLLCDDVTDDDEKPIVVAENETVIITDCPVALTQDPKVDETNFDLQSSATLEELQKRVLLLRHSTLCENSACDQFLACESTKRLLVHIVHCRDGTCEWIDCVLSRGLLGHYFKCREESCPLCPPVRAQTKALLAPTGQITTTVMTTTALSTSSTAHLDEPVSVSEPVGSESRHVLLGFYDDSSNPLIPSVSPTVLDEASDSPASRHIEMLHISSGKLLRSFDTQLEAASFLSVNPTAISQACCGYRLNAYGFRWRWCQGPLPSRKFRSFSFTYLLTKI